MEKSNKHYQYQLRCNLGQTAEIFLGNTTTGIKDYLHSLKTIRLGEQAFDIEGNKLADNYKPVFVGKKEEPAYDKIMMDRLRAKK